MCGIIGIISNTPVAERLITGLERLEYRGYDSAGIATVVNNEIERRRAPGKLQTLKNLLAEQPLPGMVGIGHTRWATHGAPNAENAHPHANEHVAVVHNGIIENYAEIKNELQTKGYTFSSETDTEVIVHLLTDYLLKGLTPLEAVTQTLSHLHGAFALAIVFAKHPNLMIATRCGSPLVLGVGEYDIMLGSDALALASWAQKLCYLEEGDVVSISKNNNGDFDYQIIDSEGRSVERPLRQSKITAEAASKVEYSHYMLKEIFEQPRAIGETLQSAVDFESKHIDCANFDINWQSLTRLTIIACGTSYYAGMVAKYWFEKYAKLHVDVDIASEFRYREPIFCEGGLTLFLSQSGETIDTLAALNMAKEQKQQTLAIVNVTDSSIARLSDNVLYTAAGPEIGVASTKAFTTQLTLLACLAIVAASKRGKITEEDHQRLTEELIMLPGKISKVLQQDQTFHKCALTISGARDALYLGRGTNYPIALEGALKLKEVSYIHAEGYPAGELKHGPIALIDSAVPVVVLAPHDAWFSKTLSNLQEVMARGGQVICFTDSKGEVELKKQISSSFHLQIIVLPTVPSFVAPILYSIPVQLLAYYVALQKGTDVDQPRNLAKSVTVE